MADAPLFDHGHKVDLGLYIQLIPDGELDLRAAARAALAFDALIRDVAEGVGLGSDIEINVIEGEQGSFHLKNVIRSLQNRLKLKAIAIAVAGIIGGMAIDEIKGEIRSALLGEEEVAVSDRSIDEIAEACLAAVQQPVAQQHLSDITGALISDKDVEGVGATVNGQERPGIIRPRTSFTLPPPTDVPLPGDTEETVTKRTKTDRETVILTEPVLTTSAKRKWRVVRNGGKEVAATMRDDVFWAKLVAGQTGLPMSGGVHLVVQLEVKSERDEETGLWRDVEFSIVRVEEWSPGPSQLSWISGPE